jgi:hypothetical protein
MYTVAVTAVHCSTAEHVPLGLFYSVPEVRYKAKVTMKISCFPQRCSYFQMIGLLAMYLKGEIGSDLGLI